MPASSTLSDPFIAAAVWTGLGALGLTLLLSLQIVGLRMALRRRPRFAALAPAQGHAQADDLQAQ